AAGMHKQLTSTGWTISDTEVVPFQTVNDWGSILAKVQSADPDLIIFTDYQIGNEASFIKQFRQNPTKSLVFMQYGPSVPEFTGLAGSAADGIIYSNIGGALDSSKWPAGKKLADAYRAAYGSDPGDEGADPYTEVMLYAMGLKKVGDPNQKAA